MATRSAVATFYLSIDDHGSVTAFAADGSDPGPDLVRDSAFRHAHDLNAAHSVVRIEVPLPPGSASASVTELERIEP